MRDTRQGASVYAGSDRVTACALLFAGQGSEQQTPYVHLRAHLPELDAHLDELLNTLASDTRQALERVRADDLGPLAGRTDYVQSWLACLHAAVHRVLLARGLRFDAYAGHSFGELSALHAAGVFDLDTFLRLAQARGRAMRQAASEAPGRLYAVRADSARLASLLEQDGVYLANLNAREQTVLGIAEADANALEQALQAAGLAFSVLPTAGAFHTPLMNPASRLFARELEAAPMAAATASVYSGRLGRAYRDEDDVAEQLALQICEPLHWRDLVHALWDDGIRVFVDAGPGRVLTALLRRELPQAQVISLDGADAEATRNAWSALQALDAPVPAPQPLPVAAAATLSEGDAVMNKYLEQQDRLLDLIAEVPVGERSGVAREWLEQTGSVMQAYLDVALARAGVPNDHSHAQPAAVTEQPSTTLDGLRRSVAKLTGHPLELVTADAELERDLGVDSVSLMELWHQLVERRPELAGREAELVGRKTLAELAAWADGEPEPAAELEPLTWMVQRVAALTGYRFEEIDPDAQLENDLGIDSVSRMELGSALLERYRGQAPAIELLMGARTLRDIDGLLGDATTPSLAAQDVAVAAVAPLPQLTMEREAQAPAPVEDADGVLAELRAALGRQVGAAVALEQDWYDQLDLDPFVVEGVLRDLIARNPRLGFAGQALLGCSSLAQVASVLAGLSGSEQSRQPAPIPLWRESWVPAQRVATRSRPQEPHVLVQLPAAQQAAVACDEVFFFEGARLRGERGSLSGPELLAPRGWWRRRLQGGGRWSFQIGAGGDAAELLQQLQSLFALVKGMQAVSRPRRIQVLIHGEAGIGGAAVQGFFKSLRQEWSDTEFVMLTHYERLTPAAVPRSLAAAPVGEIVRVGEDGELEQYQLEACTLASQPQSLLRRGDTVLVTGGGRGLGAEMVRELAASAPGRIVVLGRTAMPEQAPYPGQDSDSVQRVLGEQGGSPAQLRQRLLQIEAQRELVRLRDEIKASGAEFAYVQLDLAQADVDQVAQALAPYGPLHGVIHAAGLTRDARLERKSPADFAAVVAAKAGSWLALQPYLATQPLRFAYLISSLAAVHGTAGQGDYCAANELLNAAAQEWAQRADFPVTAIAYAPWTETGLVTPAFRRQMERLGLQGIRNGEGRAILRQLLHSPQGRGWLLASPASTLGYALGRSAA